jgi:hypothetical protein
MGNGNVLTHRSSPITRHLLFKAAQKKVTSLRTAPGNFLAIGKPESFWAYVRKPILDTLRPGLALRAQAAGNVAAVGPVNISAPETLDTVRVLTMIGTIYPECAMALLLVAVDVSNLRGWTIS